MNYAYGLYVLRNLFLQFHCQVSIFGKSAVKGDVGMQLGSGYWFYHQIQQMLYTSHLRDIDDSIEWWNEEIEKIHRRYENINWQVTEVDSGGDWWNSQIQELIRSENWLDGISLNPNIYRYRAIMLLIEKFVFKEMQINPGYCWYRQIEQLLYTTYLPERKIFLKSLWCNLMGQLSFITYVPRSNVSFLDCDDWWKTEIHQIQHRYDTFMSRETHVDSSGDWWKKKIEELLRTSNFPEMKITSRKWWYSEIKQILDKFVLKEMKVDCEYLWYRQIQLLLDTSYMQGMLVDSADWWNRQINKILELYSNFNLQEMHVEPSDDCWWKCQIEELLTTSSLSEIEINFRRDSRHWWYIRIKQLLDTFVLREMLVGIGPLWNNILKDEFKKPFFIELSRYVYKERHRETVYPPADQVFYWTTFCRDFNDVNVVILGQDPYHDENQAHGLAFSVPYGQKPPDSLVNIFNALERDGFKPPGNFELIENERYHNKKVWKCGTLEGWAEQGVLLLNVCLTVRKGKPNSHKDKGWEKFTSAVLSWLIRNKDGIVFMLWGEKAQKMKVFSELKDLMEQRNHLPLVAAHPSSRARLKGSQNEHKSLLSEDQSPGTSLQGIHPWNEHEADDPSPGPKLKGVIPFIECKHFSQCNEHLIKCNKTSIDWSRLPQKEDSPQEVPCIPELPNYFF